MSDMRRTHNIIHREFLSAQRKKELKNRPSGDMYARPDGSNGFPNPFTKEYLEGYKAGLDNEVYLSNTSCHSGPNYKAGYEDGREQRKLSTDNLGEEGDSNA